MVNTLDALELRQSSSLLCSILSISVLYLFRPIDKSQVNHEKRNEDSLHLESKNNWC